MAVVTGASSGLGESFAEALSAAGAKLVLAARRRERLDALVQRLIAAGGEALAIECDVIREAHVDDLVARACARFGTIDILVNNAGVSEVCKAEEEPLPTFRRVLDVNLVGTFVCAQRAARVMLAQGRGSIINVASILGVVGSGQIPQASYTASKGAVVNLTRELAAQWIRRGVRVNAIAPGWFPSEMTEEMFESERSQNWIKSRCPAGRPGRLSELEGPLLLLASDASSYMTGQTLLVDGGWTVV